MLDNLPDLTSDYNPIVCGGLVQSSVTAVTGQHVWTTVLRRTLPDVDNNRTSRDLTATTRPCDAQQTPRRNLTCGHVPGLPRLTYAMPRPVTKQPDDTIGAPGQTAAQQPAFLPPCNLALDSRGPTVARKQRSCSAEYPDGRTGPDYSFWMDR